MVWKNFDLLASYEALKGLDTVDVKTAMAGENGAKRVAEYKIPMSNGRAVSFSISFAADSSATMSSKMARIRENSMYLSRIVSLSSQTKFTTVKS